MRTCVLEDTCVRGYHSLDHLTDSNRTIVILHYVVITWKTSHSRIYHWLHIAVGNNMFICDAVNDGVEWRNDVAKENFQYHEPQW